MKDAIDELELAVGDTWEHKRTGYHYKIKHIVPLKDMFTRKWNDSVVYEPLFQNDVSMLWVRPLKDFIERFKKVVDVAACEHVAVAKIADDETCGKIFDFFKHEGFKFSIRPVVDVQELFVHRKDIETAKDLIEKIGVQAKITWKF